MKTFRIFLIAALALFLGASVLEAQPSKRISFDELPLNSQALIRQHFGLDKPVSVRSNWDKYEVIFKTGEKLVFDQSGNWTDLDWSFSAVPDDLIPSDIKAKIKELYPKAVIVRLKKDKRGYEVRLDNGLELELYRDLSVAGDD